MLRVKRRRIASACAVPSRSAAAYSRSDCILRAVGGASSTDPECCSFWTAAGVYVIIGAGRSHAAPAPRHGEDMEELLFGTEPIRWIQELFGLGHPLPFRLFSLLGDTWGMLFVVGVTLWTFGRPPFYAIAGIVVTGAATKVLLSTIFHQDRPEGPGIVVYEHLEVSSFPSGHVYEAVGPWGLLWVLGCAPFWVPALVATLVSLGRLYLGTHYLGDVLAGVAFAAVLVWLYARTWPTVHDWLSERGRLFFATVAVAAIGGMLAWMWVSGGTPRRYEIFGIMMAAAVALPLEREFLRYRPGESTARVVVLRVLIGIAGFAVFLLWDRSQSEQALRLGVWTAGLATLWTVLGAPALFRVVGLEGEMGQRRMGARRSEPSSDAGVER